MTIASIEIPHHLPRHHHNRHLLLASTQNPTSHKLLKQKQKQKKDPFEPNSIWVMLLQPSAQWSPEF